MRSPVVTIEIKKLEAPILVKKDTHCDQWQKYRLAVLSGKHDVASCNLECNKNDRCVYFALGKASSYVGRCDLFHSEGCPMVNKWNYKMDFYKPYRKPEPLLIKKDTHCDQWQKYRLAVLSGKHDVASCNLECNKNDRCVYFALGKASSYVGRCDLFHSEGCPMVNKWNYKMDFYKPYKKPEPILLKKDTHCD